MQAHDEVGHRPEGDLRAVRVPGDRAGNRLAVADAGGLDRSPAGALPLTPLEVGVELGDLHAGLGQDDVAALRGRIGGIEVLLADVVATVQQLGVHQPAVGDVDLRQRPARADREDALAGVAGLADQPVEGLPGIEEHVEPGEEGAVRADVVDVDDLGDPRCVRDVDAAPPLLAAIVGVDHRSRLSPASRTATARGSSAS